MRTHYLDELESVRQNLIQMGETTIALLGEAIHAVVDPNPDASARASELEAQTDHQHRMIHDQCLNLITLQAPVARDARLVTGVLDAIVDLELIGDYAYEIVMLSCSMKHRPPSQISQQMSEVGAKIRSSLTSAIESWRSIDREQALSVRPLEAAIRVECGTLYEKLSQLASTPGESMVYVDLMLICRHLERILRHAVCVASQNPPMKGTPPAILLVRWSKNEGRLDVLDGADYA
jgi:phosphate transport system protein